jgi:RNA polymerase sigma-70 factor, ECF subfamily
LIFKKDKKYSMEDIKPLLEDCLDSNAKAQQFLYASNYSFGKSVILRYSDNEMEAEEVLNDAFMKVFNNLPNFDMAKPFRAWFRTILTNTAIDYYRRNKHSAAIIPLEVYHDDPVEHEGLDMLSNEELLKLVQQLSPAYRTVLMLYAVEGFTHKEIAEKLGISEGTSKSNLSRAREKLSEMMKGKENYYKSMMLN